MFSLSLDSVSQLTVLGQIWGQLLGHLFGQFLGQLLAHFFYGPNEKVIVVGYVVPVVGLHLSADSFWDSFGDNFWKHLLGNFYGPNEKVLVVGYFVPVVETHLSADGRPHWLRMDIPFIDQFSEKTPWSAKSNYPNYFFSLGDHNSKFFFHCLSSHFDIIPSKFPREISF